MKHVAEQVFTRFEWDDGTWHEDGVTLVDGALPPTLVDFHRSCSGHIPSMTIWELLTPATSGQARYGLVYDGPRVVPLREPEGRADCQLPRTRPGRFFESSAAAFLVLGGLITR